MYEKLSVMLHQDIVEMIRERLDLLLKTVIIVEKSNLNLTRGMDLGKNIINKDHKG